MSSSMDRLAKVVGHLAPSSAGAVCPMTCSAAGGASADITAIRKEILALIEKDPKYDDGSYGPLLLRLAWHSAGTFCKHTLTGGSNLATMRFQPESDHGANAGLHVARDLLEPIKKRFPAISYADLWTLAGCVALEHMGCPKVEWFGGRTDAADGSKCPMDGRLPDASQGADHLRTVFYRMGFNDQSIVALSGAHSLGRCHKDRSGYEGPWTRNPTELGNMYYRLLLSETWVPRKWDGPLQYQDASGKLMMLPTDLVLTTDMNFRPWVELYAEDRARFLRDFGVAFARLIALGVPRS